MGKSRKGLGHIESRTNQKGTVYFFRYTDPDTHKQVRSQVYKSYEEAEKAQLRTRENVINGQPVTPNRYTVKEYSEEWLKDKRINSTYNTWKNYDSNMRTYILPELGKIKLVSLTKTHCKNFAQKLTCSSLAPATIKRVYACLCAMLNDAVRDSLIQNNPASPYKCKLPELRRKDPEILELEDIPKFIELASEDRHANMILFGLYTGLRSSEIVALEWSNVNLKTGRIDITGQMTRPDKNVEFKKVRTKTDSSERSFIAPKIVLDLLKDQKQQQKGRKLLSTWVFSRPDGHLPYAQTTTEKRTKALMKEIGRPELSEQALRRTFSTLMIEYGADSQDVDTQLGHVPKTVLAESYAKVTKGRKKNFSDKVQTVFESVIEYGRIHEEQQKNG